MKISVDGVDLFELTESQKNILKYSIPSEAFEADIKRRMKYKVMHTLDQCVMRMREVWEPKLIAAGVENIPSDPVEFAALVFSQPDYKDKAAKDAEASE